MAKRAIKLKVIETPRNEEAIELLEQALRDARSGELKGIAIASARRDGSIMTCFSEGTGNIFLLVGAIDTVLCRVRRKIEGLA